MYKVMSSPLNKEVRRWPWWILVTSTIWALSQCQGPAGAQYSPQYMICHKMDDYNKLLPLLYPTIGQWIRCMSSNLLFISTYCIKVVPSPQPSWIYDTLSCQTIGSVGPGILPVRVALSVGRNDPLSCGLPNTIHVACRNRQSSLCSHKSMSYHSI